MTTEDQIDHHSSRAMQELDHHSSRAMQELDLALEANCLQAAQAHFGLSALHLDRMQALKDRRVATGKVRQD